MFTEEPCVVQALCGPGDHLPESAQGEVRQISTPRAACMLLFWRPCTSAVCYAPVGMSLRTWKIPVLISTKHHSPEKAKYGAIQIQFLLFGSFLRRQSCRGNTAQLERRMGLRTGLLSGSFLKSDGHCEVQHAFFSSLGEGDGFFPSSLEGFSGNGRALRWNVTALMASYPGFLC